MQIADAVRQRLGLRQVEHRPWPLPERPWLMGQSWRDLLFAHWRVDPAALRRVVPERIPLDLRDGAAWIGVTPFVVSALRLHWTAPAPLLSRFEEINVRTYVSVDGKPGIYFLSLDAHSHPAVAAARRVYRLPYFHADASSGWDGGGDFHYRSRRTSRDGPPAEFAGSYRPISAVGRAEPGSLEHFLTERYCLYVLDEDQRVWRGEIHHPRWPLQRAEVELRSNTMAAPQGVELEGEPLCHFSREQHVVIWRIAPVA
jgi:uncharacterized protein YqjF (DUF2071 family)